MDLIFEKYFMKRDKSESKMRISNDLGLDFEVLASK